MVPTPQAILLGVIVHCNDELWARRIWRDLHDVPPGLSIVDIANRSKCDQCGGKRNKGASVEVVWKPWRKSAANPHERCEASKQLKAFIVEHPYGWTKRDGQWGYWLPVSD